MEDMEKEQRVGVNENPRDAHVAFSGDKRIKYNYSKNISSNGEC